MGVADVHHRDSACEVDKFVAFHINNHRTPGVCDVIGSAAGIPLGNNFYTKIMQRTVGIAGFHIDTLLG